MLLALDTVVSTALAGDFPHRTALLQSGLMSFRGIGRYRLLRAAPPPAARSCYVFGPRLLHACFARVPGPQSDRCMGLAETSPAG